MKKFSLLSLFMSILSIAGSAFANAAILTCQKDSVDGSPVIAFYAYMNTKAHYGLGSDARFDTELSKELSRVGTVSFSSSEKRDQAFTRCDSVASQWVITSCDISVTSDTISGQSFYLCAYNTETGRSSLNSVPFGNTYNGELKYIAKKVGAELKD